MMDAIAVILFLGVVFGSVAVIVREAFMLHKWEKETRIR